MDILAKSSGYSLFIYHKDSIGSKQIKEEMGGDDILAFVDHDFSAQAATAYDSLGIADLNFNNVWDIFTAMLEILYKDPGEVL